MLTVCNFISFHLISYRNIFKCIIDLTVAIQKINEIIKTEHQSSLNRPSRFTNAPPPLMSLHSGITSVVRYIFTLFII